LVFVLGFKVFPSCFSGFVGDVFLFLMLMVRVCSHGLFWKLNFCSHGISTLRVTVCFHDN
jgi:hypothetical protein